MKNIVTAGLIGIVIISTLFLAVNCIILEKQLIEAKKLVIEYHDRADRMENAVISLNEDREQELKECRKVYKITKDLR